MVGHICGNCHQSRDFNIIFYLDDYFLLEEHQSMLVTCHLSLLTLIWFNCDRRHMRAVSLDALGRVHPSASPTCCTGKEGRREGASQPLADTVRGGGVLLGREEQPPCEQTCSRATFPIPDFRTQQDETKRM